MRGKEILTVNKRMVLYKQKEVASKKSNEEGDVGIKEDVVVASEFVTEKEEGKIVDDVSKEIEEEIVREHGESVSIVVEAPESPRKKSGSSVAREGEHVAVGDIEVVSGQEVS